MLPVRFKICGVKDHAAVNAAVDAGASAIGFCFYPPSPRALAVAQAVELASHVPLWVERVALFVDAPPEQIRDTAEAIGAGTIQFHGTLTPALREALRPLRILAAVPANEQAEQRLTALAGLADAVLLDAAVKGRHGGTGQLADWHLAWQLREAHPELPLVLAGGLNPRNVGAAIRAVQPYAVDVASGVESAPGCKDPELIRAFGVAVREAERP